MRVAVRRLKQLDKKPLVDLEKLKEFQDLKKKREEKVEEPADRPKPDPKLTDPYYHYRGRHLVNIADFDDWDGT